MKKHTLLSILAAATLLFSVTGCTNKNQKKEVWIYTSLYKDTIADIQPKLEEKFPDVKFNFYQAGSEEVAAKVNAEMIAGGIQADILISSDRFWYEDMGNQGKLESFQPTGADAIPAFYRNPKGYYTTVSYPVMVLAYNSEVINEKDAPKSFKELTEPKWKGKVSSGSPLASGTNFTTMAFLKKAYGWDYYKSLRKNELIAEGGNSGVIRRLQSKERPVGIVLLENLLRLQESDPRIKTVFPEDGVVIQSNVLAIVKKGATETTDANGDKHDKKSKDQVKQIADWFFAKDGQEAMTRSFMYASMPGYEPPKGAPALETLLNKAMPWSREFIDETLQARDSLKEEFTKIVF